YRVRDECRGNLAVYTIRAFSLIPTIIRPKILDMGCGTGVPALALLGACDGTICAVDPDGPALEWLSEKAEALGLLDRITILHGTLFETTPPSGPFDIVLAEGLLNAVDFEKGFDALAGHCRENGYLIIHDEWKDDPGKRAFFGGRGMRILGSFPLDETIWGREYVAPLEEKTGRMKDKALFEVELREIEMYRLDPRSFRSIYYVIKKGSGA
ncbi:MAG: class I SAM-dependent methyltransferase, partial [Spirochaetes bacterium]|nr:class I SAM-dependent methyltransferase [Spirochaetota bacterium]